MSRRKFISFEFVCLLLLTGAAAVAASPNVVVVISDDQGYGELSAHGNPIVRTPNLDRLHAESVRLADFHVAPMCTPTRGQLMTGVDALRNGAMNVSSGRTLLRRDLNTMPQLFASGGYRTGIFGKWHLGDAYPYRPQDRGFQEALWFPSSHIGALPDFWQNDYFDDTYWRNGARTKYQGYTTDVFFEEAIAWMTKQSADNKPFFCYIPTAAPHGPHYVPTKYRQAMQQHFEKVKNSVPELTKDQANSLVRYLAMIENLDNNLGKLENFLRESKQRDNTIVIFLTDNGSTFGDAYYNAGMRGQKISLWEGGHRVPCFVRWPGGSLRQAGDVNGLTEVQDLLPTLVDLCSLPTPSNIKLDGTNLTNVLRGKSEPSEDRILVINYSRMQRTRVTYTKKNPSIPQREGAAVLWKRWRLIEDRELYNLDADPKQLHNIIGENPEVADKLRKHLDTWWAGVKDICNEFQPSVIGADSQNPTLLSACEWADSFIDQQAQVRSGLHKNGVWHIEVATDGTYELTASRYPAESGLNLNDGVPRTQVTDGTLSAGPAFQIAKVKFQVGEVTKEIDVTKNATTAQCEINLPQGRTILQIWLLDNDGKEIAGAYYVTAKRL